MDWLSQESKCCAGSVESPRSKFQESLRKRAVTIRAAAGGRVSIRYPSCLVRAALIADIPVDVIRGWLEQQEICPAQLSQPCRWHLTMLRTSCSLWAPGAYQTLLRSKSPHLIISNGLRPRHTTQLRASVAGKRQASFRLPPSIETGHIKLGPNEGILFFNSMRYVFIQATVSR